MTKMKIPKYIGRVKYEYSNPLNDPEAMCFVNDTAVVVGDMHDAYGRANGRVNIRWQDGGPFPPTEFRAKLLELRYNRQCYDQNARRHLRRVRREWSFTEADIMHHSFTQMELCDAQPVYNFHSTYCIVEYVPRDDFLLFGECGPYEDCNCCLIEDTFDKFEDEIQEL